MLSFGVSGRLYQSNVLFYDHQTESLWSQIKQEAVTGPLTGTRLRAVWSVTASWAGWRRAHPDTLVLSPETGHRRDYNSDPYARYEGSPGLMFPLRHVDPRLPPKEKIFGLRIGEASKAYRLAGLAKAKQVEDQLDGRPVRIDYDPAAQRVSAVALDSGAPLPGIEAYWFAWSAFHPDTAVWGDQESDRQRRGLQ